MSRRTEQRRKQREQEKRRNRILIIVGVVVVTAIVVGVLVLINNQPAEAPIPEDIASRYEGFQQSETEQGFARLGNPDAPVQIMEYASFTCPGCKVFHDETMATVRDYVETGNVSFTYVPMTTGSYPNPEGAAWAAICAGEQGKFWEYHDLLFGWQGEFSFTGNRLEAGVEGLGLNHDDWSACFFSQRPKDVMQLASVQSSQASVNSTPSISVGGVLVQPNMAGLTEAVDAALERLGLPPLSAQDTTEPDTPDEVEATPEDETSEDSATPAEPEPTVEDEATEEPTETEADATEDESADEEATPETEEEATPEESSG